MRVAFRRLAPGAEAPLRAHAGDAGYDLVAAEGAVLAPGGRAVVGTGIAVAVPMPSSSSTRRWVRQLEAQVYWRGHHLRYCKEGIGWDRLYVATTPSTGKRVNAAALRKAPPPHPTTTTNG